jgi:hypothetical protein
MNLLVASFTFQGTSSRCTSPADYTRNFALGGEHVESFQPMLVGEAQEAVRPYYSGSLLRHASRFPKAIGKQVAEMAAFTILPPIAGVHYFWYP